MITLWWNFNFQLTYSWGSLRSPVTLHTVNVCMLMQCFKVPPLFPASSCWTLKSSASSPSIAGVVIWTTKCRSRCRNKLTPFHDVRVQPSKKAACLLRQIETDSKRKSCSGTETEKEETDIDKYRWGENKRETEIFWIRCRDRNSKWELELDVE